MLVQVGAGPDAGRPAVSGLGHGRSGEGRRRPRARRARGARRPGCGVVRALDGRAGAGRGDAARRRLVACSASTTAGESHGPALVGILTGLPAGLDLDREAIDADLARRQQGYGRSPRQQIEQDRVEVLAGLRHGRTLGTPLALVVREPRSRELALGDEPVAAGGRARGQGDEAGHAPAPRPRRPRRDAEVRARRRPQHARAGERAPDGDHGRRGRGREGAARARSASRSRAPCSRWATSTRLGPTATPSAASSRSAPTGVPPGLGSYATKEESPRRSPRRGADGHPGRQGRRDRRGVRARGAARLPGARRDLPRRARRVPRDEPGRRDRGRRLERRGDRRPRGDEAAADADAAAALGRPRDAASRARRSSSGATSRRSRRSSVVAEASVAFELARAAREKFGGDAVEDFVAAHRAYLDRIPWQPR